MFFQRVAALYVIPNEFPKDAAAAKHGLELSYNLDKPSGAP